LLASPPMLEDLKRHRAERERQLGICDHDVNDSR
jgi:hypothetical protein